MLSRAVSQEPKAHRLIQKVIGFVQSTMIDAHFHQWLKNLSTASHDMPPSAQDVRAKFTRFRILVVGRASVSKTTLLQKVCNATGKRDLRW
jgi:predicted TIM-barrel fold metal-dependent hydrolase